MSLDDLIADAPFSYRAVRDGRVVIAYRGRAVTTLTGRAAERFLSRLESGDDRAAQLSMAKATGQFKRGNERPGKNRTR